MDKILLIAQGITNPYSLLALTYLVLFLLFKGVLAKAGPQRGDKSFQIIKYLMTLTAVVAVLTLISVFTLRGYEVYQGTVVTADKVNTNTDKVVSDAVSQLSDSNLQTADKVNTNTQNVVASAVSQLSDSDLQVEYSVDKFTGANMLIGNRGQGIIITSNLSFHWDYRECPSYDEPSVGAPLVEYRYKVDLTTRKGSKLLDTRDFKYGAGDVDKFLVELTYPDSGVYKLWFTFNYKILGNDQVQTYETKHVERWVCERY